MLVAIPSSIIRCRIQQLHFATHLQLCFFVYRRYEVMGNRLGRQELEEYRNSVDGKFDDREIKHMHKLYMRAAPTGRMGKTDFKKYIDSLQVFRRVDPNDEYEQLFRAFDADCDGVITFHEYLRYHYGMVFGGEPLVELIFAMYDVNRDQSVTRAEMVTVITASTKWIGDCDVEAPEVKRAIQLGVDRVLGTIDTDSKGYFSKDELRAAYMVRPEVLDDLKILA